MRILALDHGNARIGCAVCDPTGTLVRPLEVIEPAEPAAVAELARSLEAERIVVGLPRGLSGQEGEQAQVARQFCAELEELTEVPVELYDERLTTRMAQATRRAGAKASEDSIAAAHLLESYLARSGV
jgi:putative Holliday junction resolvase